MLVGFKAYFMTNPSDNNHLLNELNIYTMSGTVLVLEMQVINTKWSLLSEVRSHLAKRTHISKKKKKGGEKKRKKNTYL